MFRLRCEASGQLHSIALVCHDLDGQYSLLTSLVTRVENLSSSCSFRQRNRPLACPQNSHCSHLYTSPLLITSSTFHLVQDSRSCTVTSQRSSQLLQLSCTYSSVAGRLQLLVKSQLLPDPSWQACGTCLMRSIIVSQKIYQPPRISSHLRRPVE